MEIGKTSSAAFNPALDRTTTPRKAAAEQADTATGTTTVKSTPDGAAKTSSGETGTDAKGSETNASNTPQPIKSFAYGALGLEHPEAQDQHSDGYYSAGKWLAAAATVGTIISLVV
ncbi:hypothetical protein [Andreprevotia chitinilytica]|uniref:hypothetical protein n=1 Tax=Andreprevotia chitinilytica TaxID=396808 RepID=UPI00068BC4F4|nr:hypothetical protein [Andreprevotia chitinilytica]